MQAPLLILNAGSSSLKFALYRTGSAEPTLLARGQFAGIGRALAFSAKSADGLALTPPDAAALAATRNHADALLLLPAWLQANDLGSALAGAGHRVVHGGTRFTLPERITPESLDALAALEPLAPHHQPHNVAAIRALMAQQPDLPQVACFDTAFHATMPATAQSLGLPRALEAKGLRRYGFHGLSYEYVTGRLAELCGGRLPKRVIIAHLGNGASMAAVLDGKGHATTMGFSTLDGLVMGTRIGSLDPGAILHLMRTERMDLKALEDMFYNRSGLLGLSDISADMKTLLESGDSRAAAAIEQYCYAIVRHAGSLAAALGGLDALVFTGGVGENAAPIRSQVCRALAWLGVDLDETANARGGSLVTTPSSRVAAYVVPTDEELVIARHTAALLCIV
ncbi:acetate/propionate family kinase [Hypericibacter sp.]|uniref:acetate/propionate family kinase n=1 Tax=Hypericibacter sp. TaxID=2705401 RepID=UPI003D6C7470